MTTCVGLHNGTEYVLSADCRVSSGRKIGTDSQNKLIKLNEEITCAFSGSQYLFNKLSFFLKNLDDPVELVSMSSFRHFKDAARDAAEDSIAKFLGIDEENEAPSIEDSELALRIIWESFLTWIENTGTYTLEDDAVPHEYSAILLFATHLSIFEVTVDGYVSNGSIKVLGNPAALGSILADSYTDIPRSSGIDLGMKSIPLVQMQNMAERAIKIVSLIDTGTSAGLNTIVYPKGT